MLGAVGEQVASLLRSHASNDDLAVAMVSIVSARFLTGNAVPENVTLDTRGLLNSPLDLLKPGKYPEGQ